MKKFKLRPIHKILLGFLAIITAGALLLDLPISSTSGVSIGMTDAFFTSFSAVCVTGLAVIEAGTDLTIFGQTVLLVLIQAGGLGFMALATLVFMAVRKKITLADRVAIKESLGDNKLKGGVVMIRRVVIITLICEFAGMILLAIRFIPEFGFATGGWYSVFHSISAFCNAGFDILGNGNSLVAYSSDPLISFTICALIIMGGIGFFVVNDVVARIKHKTKFPIHTRLALTVTGILLVVGTVFFTIFEYNNLEASGEGGFFDKLLKGFFQSVTTRTAGFMTMDQGALTSASKLLGVALMFIGASPAGTGGGIKTTTFAVSMIALDAEVRGKASATVFSRTVNPKQIMKAFTIIALCMAFITIVTIAITLIEGGAISMGAALYETTSAFATVGLSVGITSSLSVASKILLMVAMLAGRLGVLSIASALRRQVSKNKNKITFPDGNIMIG